MSTIITIGPSLTGLRGTQLAGSINYTLVTWFLPPWRQSYALEEVLPGRAGEVDSTG
jgi:hypothetical protein